MILTCPECTARYQIEDGKIGPEGRTVRCAACAASWRAMPEVTLDRPATAGEPPAASAAVTAADTAASPARDYRDKVQARRDTVRAAGSGVAWAAVAVLLAALVAAGLVFKTGVVAAIPQAASLYAAIGQPVNPTGISIEDLAARPEVADGHALVVVTGSMRNITERVVTPDAVRVALVDRNGRELAVRIGDARAAAIPAGQAQPFSLTFNNPPVGASDVQAQLVLDPAPAGRAVATGAPRVRATAGQ